MKKQLFTLIAGSLPVLATEMPPMIPDGPVEYDTLTYEAASATQDYVPTEESMNPYDAPAYDMPAAAPMAAPSSERNGYVNLNVYTSNYNVRGMGFSNHMTKNGYSSLSGSYKFANQNLFGRGIYQRVNGSYGIIWGHDEALGDRPLFSASYALGKEIFPNLTVEAGYSLRYGGFEGYMAKHYDDSAHSDSHDLNLTLRFNDGQKGIFGSMTWGWAFKGLNGIYGDIELGYRFTNVLNGANVGADLELSAGIAPSFSYWTNSADGIDAYRIRAALPLFTHTGSIGRDARFKVIPWAQASWAGSNASKIDRDTGHDPVDQFIFTVGLDLGWHF